MSTSSENNRAKSRAAAVSVLSNSVLVAAKLVVGVVTGSVSILSEAAHSGIDLVAALIAFFAIREAKKPADDEHPFGHGKVENVSGTVEAALIIIAAVYILYEAVARLRHGGEVESLGLGVAVMALSTVCNIAVSAYLFRVARRTRSFALEADAEHLRTDVFTSLGVLVAVLVVHLTGWVVVDALAAIAVALLIAWIGFGLLRRGYSDLVDHRLPPEEEAAIRAALDRQPGLAGYHELRSRRSGADRFVEVHVLVSSLMDVTDSHEITRRIEAEVAQSLPGTRLLVHVEPCTGDCPACVEPCPETHRRPAPGLPGEPELRADVEAAVRSVAAVAGIHELHVHRLAGSWEVQVDVEVDGALTVAEGHDISRRVEAALRRAIQMLGKVTVHIEPLGHSDAL